jgi:epsilon-lactone hydrolase
MTTAGETANGEAGEPPPPVPTSVSVQAQRYLAQPRSSRAAYPAPDDHAGWQRHVAEADAYLLSLYADRDLPVTTEIADVGGVRTYVQRTSEAAEDGPVYLDIHGGGLFYGSGEVCRAAGAATATATGLETWSVDYRMPPRHPAPIPLDDCMTVYRGLLGVRDPSRIVVGGGSAGGNLAAALLVRARDEGLPLPAALVLLTPEVDLTESGDSFVTHRDVDTRLRSLRELNQIYAAGADRTHPYLSPLFADLEGFPPTFLQSGTRDLFLSNTVRMHRALRAARVQAELHVFEAMPHGGFGGTAPEDRELERELRRFVREHVG